MLTLKCKQVKFPQVVKFRTVVSGPRPQLLQEAEQSVLFVTPNPMALVGAFYGFVWTA